MRAKRPTMTKAWVSMGLTALLGGSLVYFAKPIAKNISNLVAKKPAQEEVILATIGNSDGVWIQYRQDKTKRKLNQSEISLFHKSTIYLRENQSIDVQFVSQDLVRFSGEGQFTVELWDAQKIDSPIYVNVFGTKHEVLKKGQAGEFYIQSRAAKKELMQDLVKVNRVNVVEDGLESVSLAPTSNAEELPEESVVVALADRKVSRGKENKITNGEIQTAVERESEPLRRCLVNSLRQGSDAEGQMLVAFKILPNGKTKDVQIVQDSNKNQTLSACVQSVFSRLKFQQFAGPAVMASYPINFE
jgi:hypothetical protein